MKPMSYSQWQLRSLVAASCLLVHSAACAQVQNTTTKYEYDAMGNVTKIINPNNAASVQTYDALNRLVKQVDPNNKATQYAYDGQGRLILTPPEIH